ncbi:putative membrane protein [Paenibacillus agaridevorans]|uniref:Putative membrane protein n=1 Tax=Paenibacillus agaridevorans TaxID=171404 RepID=A0A2R5EUS1_9BACL|nr:putative membrane protein [Paenibacillus agaridevorans]
MYRYVPTSWSSTESGQTALILIAGKLFNLTANLTYIQTFYLCAAIYVVQFIFSAVWLRIFKMGPFEWAWRIFTYWKVTRFLKNSDTMIERAGFE